MNLLSSVQRNIFVKLMEKLERHTAVCNIQPFSQYFWLLRSQKVGFRLNLVNFCRHGQHHITKCDELPFLQCSRVPLPSENLSGLCNHTQSVPCTDIKRLKRKGKRRGIERPMTMRLNHGLNPKTV